MTDDELIETLVEEISLQKEDWDGATPNDAKDIIKGVISSPDLLAHLKEKHGLIEKAEIKKQVRMIVVTYELSGGKLKRKECFKRIKDDVEML